ncbi:unnamed protein product, partial [Closterium sp. NIES-54]
SLPPLPRSPAPPCLPCVEGRQRATLHSSEFPPTTAPLQTLHMDLWGPAYISGTDQERYFLLIVDDYSRYTTVFPLYSKADVTGVLIPLIRAARLQLRERFWRDLPVLRLHSDRGGGFSSGLLAEFCRDEGIHQTFTLPAFPQHNGIADCRIGLIMEVARTSMIHAPAPHFLCSFVVQYAVHQLNLWPRVSLLDTTPTIRWTGEVGDASAFRIWGALSLVRESKLSPRTLCCAFHGFPTDAPPWLHPNAFHPDPLAPHFLVDPPPLVEPLEISSDSSGPGEGGDLAADDTAATRRSPRLETPHNFPPRLSSPPPQPAVVDSGAAAGGDTGGAGSGGFETGGAGSRGAEPGVADTWGAASPSGSGAVGDPTGGPGVGQPSRLETLWPQQIREWIVQRGRPGGGGYGVTTSGAAGAGGTRGSAGAGGTGGGVGSGGAGATGHGGART